MRKGREMGVGGGGGGGVVGGGKGGEGWRVYLVRNSV